ncbi:A24 family peptidase [Mycobacterium asiaticum]|uniref:Peptidase A24 n=1 Tax=Mycobacterium asiaticum TaxID=1790 RepID=A0A1A3L0I8_MYCAS|nr:A24 family peptidase [Mycobacterium asiaticum]OBJ90760.1 peptidase A24 [Mycobacterium asiaticum]
MRIAAATLVLAWMAVLCCFDIRQRRLPNALTLPGAGVILVGAVLAGHGGPALAGAAALTATYLVVHLIAPGSMGAGDVKLAVGLGGLAGCFGADVWFLAAIAAPLLTASIAVACRARVVPHGPSMAVATAAAAGWALLD